MPLNSRAKGKRAELDLISKHLLPYWPQACRNLDQFKGDGRDVLNVPGLHIQVKHVEKLNIWVALTQAETEAAPGDLPVVAFKRSRSPWYGALPMDELVPLLRLRES
jgi:hypothetical protein